MLINLDNKRWVNKYQIITIDVSYIVSKEPMILYGNMVETILEDFESGNSVYFDICKEQFEICIGVRIDILFEQKRQEYINLLLHKITINDLNLDIKTKNDYINLFKAAMELNPEWYTVDVVDNNIINYLNELIDNEHTTNTLGLSYYLEKYYMDKEKDEKLKELIEKIRKELCNLYDRNNTR